MSRNTLLTLTVACCLLSISPYPLPLSHSPSSILSGFHLAIVAHAKPIQVPVQRSNNEQSENTHIGKSSRFEDRTGHAKSKRRDKHSLAYDAILHSESQLPVFWNNHHPPSGKVAMSASSNPEAQQRRTHGKDRTVKSLLAGMFGIHASKRVSKPPPAMTSSVKKLTKSDPLRKPKDAKKSQLVQQRPEEAVVSSILPNTRRQTAASKPKTKKMTSAEALLMIGAIAGAEVASSAFETAETICLDSDNDNLIKQAIHQLNYRDKAFPREQAESQSDSSDTVPISENDSSILNRKDTLQFLHRGNTELEEPDSVQKQGLDHISGEFQPTYQFEVDLEEDILESSTNTIIGPFPAGEKPLYPTYDDDPNHSSYNNYLQDWIQYMDRKGAAALSAVLATLVFLDPSTLSGPQLALAFTFATFVAFVLLALYISYKMHRRRMRRLDAHFDISSSSSSSSPSSSSLGFFHYLTGGILDIKRQRQRHSLAALSPFSKEASAHFTLPTYRDDKATALSTRGPSYAATATSASVPGANGRSEIRRTSVARQLSISQVQALQQHAQP